VGALACGEQEGRPGAIGNNCSGKHAGFLAVARHLGAPLAGYVDPAHPVQRLVRAAIESRCAVTCDGPVLDGCSAPAWALPLRALAFGMARIAGAGSDDPAGRLRSAAMAEPWALAGTGRFATAVTERAGGRAYVKTGAEGVMVAAVPACGSSGSIGVAVKIADGAARAAEVVVATVLPRLVPGLELGDLARPVVRSWAGARAGTLRPGLLL
jgi:L-asparaginase II